MKKKCTENKKRKNISTKDRGQQKEIEKQRRAGKRSREEQGREAEKSV